MVEILKYHSTNDKEVVYLPCMPLLNPREEPSSEPPAPLFSESNPYQDGFDAGFKAGRLEALETVSKEKELLSQAQKAVQKLLNNIPQTLLEQRLKLQEEIAHIVLQIVEQFFAYQQTCKETVALQVKTALQQINQKQALVLLLHPNDIAILQEQTLDLHQYKGLRIAPDESLDLGGCRIKNEYGLFDASIERQIDRLKQVLLELRHEKHHV